MLQLCDQINRQDIPADPTAPTSSGFITNIVPSQPPQAPQPSPQMQGAFRPVQTQFYGKETT